MTTWNLGDTVTVSIRNSYRSEYRNTQPTTRRFCQQMSFSSLPEAEDIRLFDFPGPVFQDELAGNLQGLAFRLRAAAEPGDLHELACEFRPADQDYPGDEPVDDAVRIPVAERLDQPHAAEAGKNAQGQNPR